MNMNVKEKSFDLEQSNNKQTDNIAKPRAEENNENWISYKNPELLFRFVSDLYKIIPRRFNGLTAAQQKALKREVARARFLAIMPFCPARKR